MSRAFLKDDAPGEDVLVPTRAPLPGGVPNLVTPRGLAALRAERSTLAAEAARLEAGADGEGAPSGERERDRARSLRVVRAALTELDDRLASARLVRPQGAPPSEAAFGTRVRVRVVGDGAERTSTFEIVGVDEAEPLEGRVAFTAPVARAVLGLRPGERREARIGDADRTVELVAVEALEPGA